MKRLITFAMHQTDIYKKLCLRTDLAPLNCLTIQGTFPPLTS